MSSPVRTRFAPSPTGSLHVGGVRTSLYCLLFARRTGGRFLLRIEDTDRVRSTDEAARGILRDLEWLGLLWDEGPGREDPRYAPYYQSERLELYTRYAEALIEAGKAYRAWETPAELDAERKRAEAAKENYRYHRRTYTDDEVLRFQAEGRKPVVRLAAPGHGVTVDDGILGAVTVEADGLDDFVLIKADGFPTYHFAVVIDDHHMEVGLVLRGQEHLMNTHKHLLLYEAFGWSPPQHAHLPLIFNPTGSKMSKRDKAKVAREAARELGKKDGRPAGDWGWLAERSGVAPADVTSFMKKETDAVHTAEAIAKALEVDLPMIEVQDYRAGGYLPEALLNYLALLGWSPGEDREILSFAEMVDSFTLERVNKTAARFDPDKLLWMNGEYLKSMPDDALLARLDQWLEVRDDPVGRFDPDRRRRLLAMYRLRARTFVEMSRMARFFFQAPATFDDKQVGKHLDKGDGWARLLQARDALAGVHDWSVEGLQASFDALCAATGAGLGKFAQPVRVAVTGDGVSPEIYETLALLGKDETLARIGHLLGRQPV